MFKAYIVKDKELTFTRFFESVEEMNQAIVEFLEGQFEMADFNDLGDSNGYGMDLHFELTKEKD